MTEIIEISVEILPLCAAVYQKAYAQEPWNEVYTAEEAAAYIHKYSDSNTKCAYALVDGQQVLGVALGLVVPCIDSDYFRLEDVCIDPDCQRKGLGSRFMQLLARQVAAKRCDSILLGTQRGYPSHQFYLKNGFQEIESVLMYKSL